MKTIKKTGAKKLRTRIIGGMLAAASCITMAAAPAVPAAGDLFSGMAITAEAAVSYRVLYDTESNPGKNTYLPVDRNLVSRNGKFCLRFQSDGNLVVYRYAKPSNIPVWNTGTWGKGGARCTMQGDGNLVIYYSGRAIWNTGTWGNSKAQLCLADDGELFIRSKQSGRKLWSNGTHVADARDKIERMISWAVDIANDNTHCYSQQNRLGPNYDCSSFVSSAANQAGFGVKANLTTYIMKENFVAAGFTWIPWKQIGSTANLKRGDILLKINNDSRGSGHTELYLGDNRLVGAHCTKKVKADEISTCNYFDHAWDGVLRYNG